MPVSRREVEYVERKGTGHHPMAMQMRFLQTLVEVGAENNTTIVFPVPMELGNVSQGRC